MLKPYVEFGLGESKRLYEAQGPSYFPNQTYVDPSGTTLSALQAGENRATAGSPLLRAAQAENLANVQGQYLGGNPFFQGAFKPAAQAAETQFKTTLGDIASKSSLAGRYGSGAMGSLQDRATGVFGQQLANTAGQLAYQNYAQERGMQQQATMAAPQMASADYQDIQNMLAAGQAREGYTGAQTQADIQRFNFLQNQPQQNLQNYLSLVYGNPLGRVGQSTSSGSADTSGLQNLLGIAAVGGGLYKNLGGSSGIGNLWNSASSWLGGGNEAAVTNPYFSPYTPPYGG
jgi:hypothetical protein